MRTSITRKLAAAGVAAAGAVGLVGAVSAQSSATTSLNIPGLINGKLMNHKGSGLSTIGLIFGNPIISGALNKAQAPLCNMNSNNPVAGLITISPGCP